MGVLYWTLRQICYLAYTFQQSVSLLDITHSLRSSALKPQNLFPPDWYGSGRRRNNSVKYEITNFHNFSNQRIVHTTVSFKNT